LPAIGTYGLEQKRFTAAMLHAQQEDYDGDGIGNFCDDCDCWGLGDFFPDEVINPVDVAYLVNFVYKEQELEPYPLINCEVLNGDWNCDGAINPVDVTYIVNYVYRASGQGPCNPCE